MGGRGGWRAQVGDRMAWHTGEGSMEMGGRASGRN